MLFPISRIIQKQSDICPKIVLGKKETYASAKLLETQAAHPRLAYNTADS